MSCISGTILWQRLRTLVSESLSALSFPTSQLTFVLLKMRCSILSSYFLILGFALMSSFLSESFWIGAFTSSVSSLCLVLICYCILSFTLHCREFVGVKKYALFGVNTCNLLKVWSFKKKDVLQVCLQTHLIKYFVIYRHIFYFVNLVQLPNTY